MNKLERYRDAIVKLCKAHRVKSLYTFGSVLTDRFDGDSDIDLIVDFTPMQVEDYADNYFDFKFSLQDIFKRPVDLLEEKAIKNPYFCKI
ncbi:nucleotidyltransferase family protein [Dyadobacter crusticola]|uniref:nucleotidyltransferase family protein n=1 Tax=Dyadobacter crusticola TaxID=292407 RepID=UPI000A709151|nr:nucleotidyltransferase domain-containing protein [Dyadobacter crusticola]